ncbi:MAG: ATP synthase F1 subunit gamma [Phycisphaeraceae bacterium]|nr:ATP synthase F1 subunit gamma [Phycisphaeraceae bacterium]
MKAVGNIKRITRTMQMIATAKFAAAQTRATAAKPYTEGVFKLVQELAATAGDIDHPLISGPGGDISAKPELVLILTSDRGLCGPYNGGVLRLAMSHLRSLSVPCETELVGKKGVAFLKFQGKPATRHHTHFGDNPHREEIEHLAQEYMDRFSAGELSAVRVVYTRFISAGKQSPEILQLLPLKPPSESGEGEKASGPGALYEFSPEAGELLSELLPETVRTTLAQCFSDAIVSEHVSRMVAMKSATDAAGKMGKTLTRQYNRARQAQITTELTEIISGAAALE